VKRDTDCATTRRERGDVWRTQPASTLTASASSQPLIPGDGARDRLIVCIVPVTTLDPETCVAISPDADPLSFPLVVLTVQSPYAVLKYEEFGDAIRQPMNARANAAAVVVSARGVHLVPEEYR
jgi:hypothetical protein